MIHPDASTGNKDWSVRTHIQYRASNDRTVIYYWWSSETSNSVPYWITTDSMARYDGDGTPWTPPYLRVSYPWRMGEGSGLKIIARNQDQINYGTVPPLGSFSRFDQGSWTTSDSNQLILKFELTLLSCKYWGAHRPDWTCAKFPELGFQPSFGIQGWRIYIPI